VGGWLQAGVGRASKSVRHHRATAQHTQAEAGGRTDLEHIEQLVHGAPRLVDHVKAHRPRLLVNVRVKDLVDKACACVHAGV
jgi:hypothetical protein